MENLIQHLPIDPTNYIAKAIDHRRHLHQYPELSFEEHQTTAYIIEQLKDLDIEYKTVAKTGVIGFIKGNGKTNKTIALRADIDALPILEANEETYKSTNPGTMHACGHDFHTANLLGVAALLKKIEEQLDGQVILIFQAAEEKIPGGAIEIVRSGVLDVEHLIGVIGQHVSPGIDVGKFGFRPAHFMASADEIYIKILGKGGHAAQPHLNQDPVIVAAQILVSLQQICSRYADPRIPTVLSFGKVIANGSANVIPDNVQMDGTLRTFDDTWRAEAIQRIRDIVTTMAESFGLQAEIEIRNGYPSLINDPKLIQELKNNAIALFGSNQVLDIPLWTAAEDFAYYAQKYPAAFYLIGTKNVEKGIYSELHTPTFQIDEEILAYGIKMMVQSVLSLFKSA